MSFNPEATIHESLRSVACAAAEAVDQTVTLSSHLFICMRRDEFMRRARREITDGAQAYYRRTRSESLCVYIARPDSSCFLTSDELRQQDEATFDAPLSGYACEYRSAKSSYRLACGVWYLFVALAVLVVVATLVMLYVSSASPLITHMIIGFLLLLRLFTHYVRKLLNYQHTRIRATKATLELARKLKAKADLRWIQGDPRHVHDHDL